MTHPVAVVGMACRFPDAPSPAALWEAVLARRQAFRAVPTERLAAEYADPAGADPDRLPPIRAAVLEGYEFDRARFRVPGSGFRAADIAHWLALDVAAGALADAGLTDLPAHIRDAAAVYVGNSLTGDRTRATALRVRWPYAGRAVRAALASAGVPPEAMPAALAAAEAEYKRPFPVPDEETLAGSLSNTIAGRIVGAFGLRGGGYVLDGACASSLLAIAHACGALHAGDIDLALAGGVDLSLDPMELVGFARAGALARDEMRVYDARAAGFWPGEGCGFVALMRLADAAAAGQRVYAVVRGWGVSSDGTGGITRPDREGQRLALDRAYRRAGYAAGTVGYFEGHGTGTAVGDHVELTALSEARGPGPAAAVGSVKANIGHTKAAAGVAGFLKAVMAVHTRTLPPHAGCLTPRPELVGPDARLRVLATAEAWPVDRPRAGVSAAGFGGINVHVTVEAGPNAVHPADLAPFAPSQDAELFALSADTPEELQTEVRHLLDLAPKLSRAELTDLAAHLAARPPAAVRAAVVAATPEELADRLALLDGSADVQLDSAAGVFRGAAVHRGRVGFLFPGQGAAPPAGASALGNRFRAAVDPLDMSGSGSSAGTAADTQYRLTAAALHGLRVLAHLGVEASEAVGHSLGELPALHWAGAMDADDLLCLARARGEAFDLAVAPDGAMAAVGACPSAVAALGVPGVTVACRNAPTQTTVSGDEAAVAAVVVAARRAGWAAHPLRVTHAFHSPHARPAATRFAEVLRRTRFARPTRRVISTVTGQPLTGDADIPALLVDQITRPVLFEDAVWAADAEFWVEVGAGTSLAGLVREVTGTPVASLNVGGDSVRGLLLSAAAAFVLGAFHRPAVLFADRFTRPFDPQRPLRFLGNPCDADAPPEGVPAPVRPTEHTATTTAATTAFDLARTAVAAKAELPPDAVGPDTRLARDLHLNSITVGQLVVDLCRTLGLSPPAAPTDYADATVGELVRSLEERQAFGTDAPQPAVPAGVADWVRPFVLRLVERPAPRRRDDAGSGEWVVHANPVLTFARAVHEALVRQAPAGGVLVCADTRFAPPIAELLAAAGSLDEMPAGRRLVLAHTGGAGASVARTLHLERPDTTVVVVTVPFEVPAASGWVADEVVRAEGYVEARYDKWGRRFEPVLSPLEVEPSASFELGPDDVLLVSGGGKGIAAECALALARSGGTGVGIVGRSPVTDAGVAEMLARAHAAGVVVEYASADVTDAAAVRAAVRRIEGKLGRVTGVLHAAGLNAPRRLSNLTAADFERTIGPKVCGLRNLLAAIDPGRLRVLAAFGSVIARTGLPGEADYGLANELLATEVERFHAERPGCRCLTVEWSVWSGVGMGERLGRVDALRAQGITPISPDEGVRAFRHLFAASLPVPTVVATGRLGQLPTLRFEIADGPPFLRFLDRPRVRTAGVELVADCDLAAATDPYLEEHALRGERLFPAVLGLEAMAQAARGVGCAGPGWVFEGVRFDRPVVMPSVGSAVLRVAALRHADRGGADLTVRCDQTGFAATHFAATARPLSADEVAATPPPDGWEWLADWDPTADLYSRLLFHTGRFQRVVRYRRLCAGECVAEVSAGDASPWFSPLLPGELLLGDPGARDAALHAIQACVPHRTVLPLAVERIVVRDTRCGPRIVHAVERRRGTDEFVFDLVVSDPDGREVERWTGLRLRAVGPHRTVDGLHPALVAANIERALAAWWGWAGRLVASTGADSSEVKRVLAAGDAVFRRADGKPCLASDGEDVSVSRVGSVALGVRGLGRVACDLERVTPRPAAVWRDLIGEEREALAAQIEVDTGDDTDVAATRVWTATECLKKLGASASSPLALGPPAPAGWVTFTSGAYRVATYRETLAAGAESLVWAVGTTEPPAEPDAEGPREVWA